MSDVGIDFSFGTIALPVLMGAFLPLTIVAGLAANAYVRGRRSRAALLTFVVSSALWLGSGVGWIVLGFSNLASGREFDAYRAAHERTLVTPETIGHLRFPAGTLVHDDRDAGLPIAATLPEPTDLGGVPVRDTVHVFPASGLTGDITLARDATVNGLPCSAASAVTYAAGKLAKCRLAKPATIAGVPCAGDVDLSDGVVCTLASTHRAAGIRFAAGTEWDQTANFIVATVASAPPDLVLFGSPLGAGTDVRIERGAIDVSLRTTIYGCAADHVRVRHGDVTAVGAQCSVKLPASDVSFSHAEPR